LVDRSRALFTPALLALILTAFACPSGGAPGARPDPRAGSRFDPTTVLRGEEQRRGLRVYRRENCGRCHTLFETPPEAGPLSLPGLFQPAWLSRVGPDLGSEGHRRSDDWHYAHLYAPALLIPGSRMPASRHLFTLNREGRPVPSESAIDLVAYLQALGRGGRDVWAEFRRREPDIPEPPIVTDRLLARGRDLYRRHCAACHGEKGDGGGEAAALLAVPPRDFLVGDYRFKSTPWTMPPHDADLFRIISLGTGKGSAMPSFAWLPSEDHWALVARVKQFSPSLRRTGLDRDAPLPPEMIGEARTGRADESSGDEGHRVWTELGCPACHEDASVAPRAGKLDHACDLRGGASPRALRRAVVVGVGLEMPSYAGALPPDVQSLRPLMDYLSSRLMEKGRSSHGARELEP
jgi:mono/diheme cytochrome c family protein